MNNKKLWYPAALALALSVAFGAAQASAIEQTGTPGSAAPLGTYGVDVSTKAGLKNLLPAGWNLYIYKNTPLPSTISWTVQDTWLTALDRFASNNSLAVRVDWSAKALFVSTPDIAQQERAKLAELEVPTKTPLPAYSAAPTAPAAPVAATSLAAANPVAPATPVAQVKPAAAVEGEPTASRVSPDLLARALAKTAGAPTATPVEPAAAAPAPVAAVKPVAAPQPTPAPVDAAPSGRMHVVGGSGAPVTLTPATPGSLPTLAPRQQAPVAVPVNPARQLVSAQPAQPAAQAPVQVAPLAPPTRPAPAVVQATPAPFLQQAAPVASLPVARPAPVAQPAAPAGQAYAHGNMEDIVRSSAAKHGYQVTWETVSLPLTGPVTFLGVDPAEDMKLLQKSLGNRQSPIAVEVYRGSNLIRVTANNGSREPLAVYDSSYSGVLSYGARPAAAAAPLVSVMPVQTAPATQLSPVSAPEPVAQIDVTVRAPEAAPAPVAAAPAELKLHIEKGESLSKALSAFLAAQKWELRWQVPSDMEADFPVDLSGTDIKQVLKSLLPKLGLDTDMYAPSRVVVIRPLDNTAE